MTKARKPYTTRGDDIAIGAVLILIAVVIVIGRMYG